MLAQNFREARGEHGAARVPERFGVAFRQDPGKHAAGTNVSSKSLRWDLEAGSQLKSQGKWLGVGGTFCGTLRTFVGI